MSPAPRSRAPRAAPPRAGPPGLAAREAALALLTDVLDHARPLDVTADDAPLNALPQRDRALARAIVATALRRHGEVAFALDRLIERRPPRRAGPLMRVLEIAATQILFMEVPDHAAVSLALTLLDRHRDGRHFKGLANAVLRRLAREKETILAGCDAARLDTPDWLWQRWTDSFGETTARRIAEMHLVEPGLDLSVKSDPAGWADRVGGVVLATGTVRLVPSGPVEALPGYDAGEWWVQDAAAALPARLLGDVAGKRVADLCAAPGGKTAALAAAGAKVTAVDIAAARLARLTANLARLGLAAETVAADILSFTPPEPFDAVLLDAPCTATGTIRRHPDIARLKRPEDVASLAALQARMIDRALAMLAPGGILVYCTCSLEPEEGEHHLARLGQRDDVEILPVAPAEIGGLAEILTPEGAVRTLPCQLASDNPRLAGLDGFFIMRVRKRGNPVRVAPLHR